MKIFNAEQIREWDNVTMKEQGLSSTDLMEIAANTCYEWMHKFSFIRDVVHVFCGKGNNGGDGLALARILIKNNVDARIYILESGKEGTAAFQQNLQRLHLVTTKIQFIQENFTYPAIDNNDLLVDALFGTGLNKPLTGVAAGLVEFLNKSSCPIISVDMPSGMRVDKSSKGTTVVMATHTVSFQNYKQAFLMAENQAYFGEIHLLNIGLSKDYETKTDTSSELVDHELIKSILHKRNKFAHKGNFGHALLVAGSFGMMGAAVLAAKACLGSGVGKLTCIVPGCGYHIIQATVPEAMCMVSGEENITEINDIKVYSAAGIGPGIGRVKATAALLKKIFVNTKIPLLLDADALNCLADDESLFSILPAGSLLTPHPKEFERMFGKTENDFEMLELAVQKAAILQICIVLKGHHTAIITPAGKVYFNNTGNAGMAKAAMGDVLTGITTGLMAQGYNLPEAAILGVWLHGAAGDIAAAKFSMQAMQATNLIDCLGEAWNISYR